MGLSKTIWTNPTEYLRNQQPENPVLFFAPQAVQATARRFLQGFPGLVTYAVKSNPSEEVVENLIAAGVKGFDCASPFEIDLIRRLDPDAAIHYHNPVRSRAEIAFAIDRNVTSWSVDSRSELAKLIELVPANGCEANTLSDVAHCGACGVACDARFADCNGLAADGCEVDTRSDTAHCGACDATCSLTNGDAVCDDGACALDECEAGYSDCDGDPANGCEIDLAVIPAARSAALFSTAKFGTRFVGA